MIKTITSPWKDEFIKMVEQSNKSIKITSPFLSNDICSELLARKNKASKIILITSIKFSNILVGSLDLEAIENLIKNGGKIRNHKNLHSKIYIFDDEQAIVSSSNLTYGGLVKNFEYGIFIDDKNIVKKIVKDFHKLNASETTSSISISKVEILKKLLENIPKRYRKEIMYHKTEQAFESQFIIKTPVEAIINSLTGWKLEVFKCINSINNQVFSLNDMNQFSSLLKLKYPRNDHIPDKIRQQLQYLRDLGLIEFLGHGQYQKMWIDV